MTRKHRNFRIPFGAAIEAREASSSVGIIAAARDALPLWVLAIGVTPGEVTTSARHAE